jgi:diguanylate cyclase (GGDEF)-like protein
MEAPIVVPSALQGSARLLEQIAKLTSLRDREALDAGLVTSMVDLTRAKRVAVHRVVGDEGAERWLTRAHWEQPAALSVASMWTDLADQPTLEERPAWQNCLASGHPIPWRAPDGQTLFPLPGAGQGQRGGVVEVVTDKPLTTNMWRGAQTLLAVIANQLGLLDYSERDTLTGLLNRKSFDESFYKVASVLTPMVPEMQTERRQAPPASRYWLAVLDIDHFKLVNDRFGHLIGDEVLLLISQVMCSSFRYYDQLYRFGGEEFVVILRCPTEQEAMAAFDRFRYRVEHHLFPQVEHITVSIGFTDVRAADSPVAAVERADRAVYFAKHNGRNQVHCMETLVREGHLDDDNKAGDIDLF